MNSLVDFMTNGTFHSNEHVYTTPPMAVEKKRQRRRRHQQSENEVKIMSIKRNDFKTADRYGGLIPWCFPVHRQKTRLWDELCNYQFAALIIVFY